MQVVIDVVGWAMIGISIAALAFATWCHIMIGLMFSRDWRPSRKRRRDGGDA